MVGYMSLEEQGDADFSRACRRALLRRAGTHLRRATAPNRLLCFDDTRSRLGAWGRIYRGLRVVRSTDVVGSVGRCSEFDRSFLPARASTEPRWKRVDRAFHRMEELPLVILYKIGDAYFVLDGNHRVSVARFHGVEWMDAEVTELRVPSPGGRKGRDIRSESPETGGLAVHDMMERELAKQRREEMMREAEQSRLTKELRDSRKKRRGAGRAWAPAWALAWELERIAGHLLKLSRSARNRGRTK
jgi:hypothetical protein